MYSPTLCLAEVCQIRCRRASVFATLSGIWTVSNAPSLNGLQLSLRQITAENIITVSPRISFYNGQQNKSQLTPSSST